MKAKAQAGLEYLITYSWALVVVATVVGLLIFAFGNLSGGVTCNSSDPSKMPLKGYVLDSENQKIKLQNATGGNITLESQAVKGSGTGFKETGHVVVPGTIPSGGTIEITPICEPTQPGTRGRTCHSGLTLAGALTLTYTDATGFEREVAITCNGKIP